MAWKCPDCLTPSGSEPDKCSVCGREKGANTPYAVLATKETPALIVYVIDCSGSMGEALGNETRMEAVNRCLVSTLRVMVRRSTKGNLVSPRYQACFLAYSSDVTDVLPGFKTCADLANSGMPQFKTGQYTNTAEAFKAAKRLLEGAMKPSYPAPLVCHLTDGQWNNGGDPLPHAKEIMKLRTKDGSVLLQNIYVNANLTAKPVTDAKAWAGCLSESELTDPYAKKLFEMSSPLPDSYRSVLSDDGYKGLKPGARMLLPGQTPELVQLGFVMSGATPTRSLA